MSSKKTVKEIRIEILKEDCDYNFIYEFLEDDYEGVISGILNSFRFLFKHIDEDKNKEKLNNLIEVLNTYLNKHKNKNNHEILNNKIEVFLENIGKTFDYTELIMLEKYIAKVTELQNKCLLNTVKKQKSDKYYFIKYLIFDARNVELLCKYLYDNMKEILINNNLLKSIFSDIIEKYISIDEDNTIEINYYNQVINIFLREKLSKKIFNDNDNIMKVLYLSNKKHVIDLINKIENNMEITREKLASEYNISLILPKDLEEIKYTDNNMVDFTNQNIITIDGEDDLCLDDALYAEKNSDGTYTLYIHLANPTPIISYNSLTMKEALKRNKTIYLPDMNIPIFNDDLAYNILSILPGKKTNTFTFKMIVDSNYQILLDTVEMLPGVVINKNKLSYNTADKILKNPGDDELSNNLILLSNICNKLSKDQLEISNYHKIENIARNNKNTNSANSDISEAHKMVENSMTFVNRLPDVLNKYYHYDLVLPYRVQSRYQDEIITDIIKNIDNVNENNPSVRKVLKEYMLGSKYSPKNTGHVGLGVDGYVRIGSSARRAMDCLALYILNDLVINRNKGDLDIKNYFWEEEVKYWCEYANNKSSEIDNFIEEYSYLHVRKKLR